MSEPLLVLDGSVSLDTRQDTEPPHAKKTDNLRPSAARPSPLRRAREGTIYVEDRIREAILEIPPLSLLGPTRLRTT